jgi:hypothetical protein
MTEPESRAPKADTHSSRNEAFRSLRATAQSLADRVQTSDSSFIAGGNRRLCAQRLTAEGQLTLSSGTCTPQLSQGDTSTPAGGLQTPYAQRVSQWYREAIEHHEDRSDGLATVSVVAGPTTSAQVRCPIGNVGWPHSSTGTEAVPPTSEDSPPVLTDGGVPNEDRDETDEKPFPRAIYGPCPICEGVINSHPFECEDCGFRPYMSDGADNRTKRQRLHHDS